MPESRHVRYSVRRGLREPFGFHEGIPEHIRVPLLKWAREQVTLSGYSLDEEEIERVISALEIHARAEDLAYRWSYVEEVMDASDETFLDVLDALLNYHNPEALEAILHRGRSLHTVAANEHASRGYQLEARVTDEARATYESAIAPRDEIAEDLSEAWRRAFSRDDDASDSYQHSVRAVEGALYRIVTPQADRAQLGKIIQAIKDAPHKWEFALSEGDGPGGGNAVVPVLELIGYDPGRHPGASSVKPTLEQAQAVAVLAATVVEWVRRGALKER